MRRARLRKRERRARLLRWGCAEWSSVSPGNVAASPADDSQRCRQPCLPQTPSIGEGTRSRPRDSHQLQAEHGAARASRRFRCGRQRTAPVPGRAFRAETPAVRRAPRRCYSRSARGGLDAPDCSSAGAIWVDGSRRQAARCKCRARRKGSLSRSHDTEACLRAAAGLSIWTGRRNPRREAHGGSKNAGVDFRHEPSNPHRTAAEARRRQPAL
jgi:hypothetical protein